MTTNDDGTLRGFDTGATRDTAEGKLSYFGFLSPIVLKQYAKFMNMNRLQSDGKLRDSDNWQNGIPIPVYFESEGRHHMEFFEMARVYEHLDRNDKIEMIGSACGLLFNVMGFLHEFLKTNPLVDFDGVEPTQEMEERQDRITARDEVKKLKALQELQPWRHHSITGKPDIIMTEPDGFRDGCLGCKYETVYYLDEPCSDCIRNVARGIATTIDKYIPGC